MSLPDAQINIQDGALGLSPQNGFGVQAKVGVCSLGTANQVYSFGDSTLLQATLGTGPLVEAAVDALERAGGPIICVPVNASVAGANSAVTAGAGNTSTSVLTLTGTPKDNYELKVLISTQGPVGTVASGDSTFQYSLDNGRTYSGQIAIAATYVMPNTGVTLNFAAGTVVKGDTFTATSTAPGYSTGDLNTALAALAADPSTWFMVHVVGFASSAANQAAVFSAFDTWLTARETAFTYTMGLIEMPDVSDSLISASFLALTSKRVAVAAGFCAYASAVTGYLSKRPAAWPIASRLGKVRPAEDPGKVKTGALSGVSFPKGFTWRDEANTPALDAINIMTLRTYKGLPGIFCTAGRLKAGPTSDYQLVTNRRVMDIASTVVRQETLNEVNNDLRVNAATGTILEADAQSLEKRIVTKMRDALTATDNASDVQATVSRTDNILATATLNIQERVIPKGYSRYIVNNIGFLNPAVVVA